MHLVTINCAPDAATLQAFQHEVARTMDGLARRRPQGCGQGQYLVRDAVAPAFKALAQRHGLVLSWSDRELFSARRRTAAP